MGPAIRPRGQSCGKRSSPEAETFHRVYSNHDRPAYYCTFSSVSPTILMGVVGQEGPYPRTSAQCHSCVVRGYSSRPILLRLRSGSKGRHAGGAASSKNFAPPLDLPMKFMIRHINCHLPDWKARLITIYSFAL